jgi:hypothetical protein
MKRSILAPLVTVMLVTAPATALANGPADLSLAQRIACLVGEHNFDAGVMLAELFGVKACASPPKGD